MYLLKDVVSNIITITENKTKMKTRIKIIAAIILIGLFTLTSCMKKPMACFDASSTTINAGQTVSFSSSCSMDAHHFEWSFGDGGTSTDANPSHVYNTAGSYTVKLKTMSKNGNKMDETTKTITVN